MKAEYIHSSVLDNRQLQQNIFEISIGGEFKAEPGQFYMLRGGDKEPFLSRPISVHSIDNDKITFLYQVKGDGTKKISKLQTGDDIKLLGPCGNGFNVDNIKGKVAVIAGGIGIAPLLYTVQRMKESSIDLYAGFRESPFIPEQMKDIVDNLYVTTEYGKEGIKGYITDIFSPLDYNAVICCGPEIMMEKVIKVCKNCATPVYVSMEKHMACGVGACLVCTCKTTTGMKRTCKDGPVFSGRDVILGA